MPPRVYFNPFGYFSGLLIKNLCLFSGAWSVIYLTFRFTDFLFNTLLITNLNIFLGSLSSSFFFKMNFTCGSSSISSFNNINIYNSKMTCSLADCHFTYVVRVYLTSLRWKKKLTTFCFKPAFFFASKLFLSLCSFLFLFSSIFSYAVAPVAIPWSWETRRGICQIPAEANTNRNGTNGWPHSMTIDSHTGRFSSMMSLITIYRSATDQFKHLNLLWKCSIATRNWVGIINIKNKRK